MLCFLQQLALRRFDKQSFNQISNNCTGFPFLPPTTFIHALLSLFPPLLLEPQIDARAFPKRTLVFVFFLSQICSSLQGSSSSSITSACECAGDGFPARGSLALAIHLMRLLFFFSLFLSDVLMTDNQL